MTPRGWTAMGSFDCCACRRRMPSGTEFVRIYQSCTRETQTMCEVCWVVILRASSDAILRQLEFRM